MSCEFTPKYALHVITNNGSDEGIVLHDGSECRVHLTVDHAEGDDPNSTLARTVEAFKMIGATVEKVIVPLDELDDPNDWMWDEVAAEAMLRMSVPRRALVPEKDRNDMFEFIKDHIKHFAALPLEFEASDGYVYDYDSITSSLSEEQIAYIFPTPDSSGSEESGETVCI